MARASSTPPSDPPPGPARPRRLRAVSGGFLRERRLSEILRAHGIALRYGVPLTAAGREGAAVAVWGRRPVSARGRALARALGLPVVTLEDAPLRGLLPGRSDRLGPLGLTLDGRGVHYDPEAPSDLEALLAGHPLDDPALLARARDAVGRMQAAHLSKYSAVRPELEPPARDYVLLIDQCRGDASVTHGGAGPGTFRRMLRAARAEHPGRPILIKTHPAAGRRGGYLRELIAAEPELVAGAEVHVETRPLSPWRLIGRAAAIHAVSSQLALEAILAGRRPVLWGRPAFAGWGLSEDRGGPLPRRGRALRAEQLAAAVLILWPLWFDPFRRRACEIETVLDILEAAARAWREDRAGHVLTGMRAWKRPHMARFFSAAGRRPRFAAPARAVAAAQRSGRALGVWGAGDAALLRRAEAAGVPVARIEDGFLRSRGLGAELVPPLSLVRDPLGIYYDPSAPSLIERLLAEAARWPADHPQIRRARALIGRLRALGLSKYNLGGTADLPPTGGRPVVLVPGQVEDDASIRLGCPGPRRNAELLAIARERHPDAFLIYKPHPDVEAGLRPGRLAGAELAPADHVAERADPAALLARADRVVTLTSLMGFEALIRGVPVTCLGLPFYAGWGLTEDLAPPPARRAALKPSLEALVWAALIAAPRYRDPLTGLIAPAEVIVDRLASGPLPRPGPLNRALARLQGALAPWPWLWR